MYWSNPKPLRHEVGVVAILFSLHVSESVWLHTCWGLCIGHGACQVTKDALPPPMWQGSCGHLLLTSPSWTRERVWCIVHSELAHLTLSTSGLLSLGSAIFDFFSFSQFFD
jgi:hypothetical protein